MPFLAYAGVFLLLPTGIVIWNAFKGNAGGLTLSNITALNTGPVRSAFKGSLELCLISSVIGAALGAVLAYAVASGNPDGLIRRLYLAGSGVLAQFGGVTLAFAFLATIGPAGFITHTSWYSNFPLGHRADLLLLPDPAHGAGLPARHRRSEDSVARSSREPGRVDVALLALRWRPAARAGVHSALPCCCSPTRCRLSRRSRHGKTRSTYVVPQAISGSLISEVGLANVHQGDALALGMIVMVVIVMTGYALLQRRAARWQR